MSVTGGERASPGRWWRYFHRSFAGRYLAFRCRLPDRPGSLAKLLGDLADLGANVLEVAHERLAPRLHLDEAEVIPQVETCGPGYCDEVIAALRAADYTLAFAKRSLSWQGHLTFRPALPITRIFLMAT